MLPRLNSLWVGNQLGYLEQLCLVSATTVGHHVTLYSYTPEALRGVPPGIALRDAREVMPEDRLVSYANSGSFALGANLFRYALLSKDIGYWIDMDFYVIKSLDFKEKYVFGWQDETSINNAVLHIPATSDFVRDLCEIPQPNRRPPWFGPKRTLGYFWNRLTKGRIEIGDFPWGTFGPRMVTYLAEKHNVADQAQQPDVFYPVKCQDARLLYGSPDAVERMITPNTRAIHMWHSALYGLRETPPPKGSYIDTICRKHGVETRLIQ